MMQHFIWDINKALLVAASLKNLLSLGPAHVIVGNDATFHMGYKSKKASQHGPAHVLAGLHAPRAVPGQPACSKLRPRHGPRPFTGRHGPFSGVLCRAFCVPGSRALGRAAKSTARWPGLLAGSWA
jgi:hypothetical protein